MVDNKKPSWGTIMDGDYQVDGGTLDISLPTLKNANDINVVIGKDGTLYEYQFNLGKLVHIIKEVITHIDGPVAQMPTHEDISKHLKCGVGHA